MVLQKDLVMLGNEKQRTFQKKACLAIKTRVMERPISMEIPLAGFGMVRLRLLYS